jgi:hypothetical protein
MADRGSNLGKYLHPRRESSGEGSPADERADRAGMRRTGMNRRQWEASAQDQAEDARQAAPKRGTAPDKVAQAPKGPRKPATRVTAPPSAEERFWQSAGVSRHAPEKGR